MTIAELAQLITSVATLLGVLVGAYISLRNGRKIATVATATDGMKTELVNLTAKSSKAEGVLAGRAQVHEEQGNGGRS